MFYYYEFGSVYQKPCYYCLKCENKVHFTYYDKEKHMCHTCVMSEEVDRTFYDDSNDYWGYF